MSSSLLITIIAVFLMGGVVGFFLTYALLLRQFAKAMLKVKANRSPGHVDWESFGARYIPK